MLKSIKYWYYMHAISILYKIVVNKTNVYYKNKQIFEFKCILSLVSMLNYTRYITSTI